MAMADFVDVRLPIGPASSSSTLIARTNSMPGSSSDNLALTASMTSRWSSAIRIFMSFFPCPSTR
jgi:hypothetical protein